MKFVNMKCALLQYFIAEGGFYELIMKQIWIHYDADYRATLIQGDPNQELLLWNGLISENINFSHYVDKAKMCLGGLSLGILYFKPFELANFDFIHPVTS